MPKVPTVPPAQTMCRHGPRCLPAGASARTGTEEAATVTAVVASRGRVGSAGKGGAPLSLPGKQEEFHLGTKLGWKGGSGWGTAWEVLSVGRNAGTNLLPGVDLSCSELWHFFVF